MYKVIIWDNIQIWDQIIMTLRRERVRVTLVFEFSVDCSRYDTDKFQCSSDASKEQSGVEISFLKRKLLKQSPVFFGIHRIYVHQAIQNIFLLLAESI